MSYLPLTFWHESLTNPFVLLSVEDMYLGYLIKMTWLNLIGINTGPQSNKKAIQYPLEIVLLR
jgi:hypothetical protein